MPGPDTGSRGLPRARVIAASTLLLAAWWAFLAWLSRDVRPWAMAWTGPLMAVGLVLVWIWGCVTACALARRRRPALLRVATVSLLLVVLLVLLEIPALFGRVDYGRLSMRLLDDPGGPSDLFVEDRALDYRRPPNVSWAGRPRSVMAREFNLPIRPPRLLTFATDASGFRNLQDRTCADAVLLGDSYIEGDYVSDEETVAVALESMTGAPVANLGVSGYGTLQERVVLERYGLPLAPRFVAWFFFEGNDLYNDADYEGALLYYKQQGDVAPGGHPEPIRKKKVRTWRGFVKTSFTANAFRVFRAWIHPLLPSTVATFGWFRDERGRDHRMYFYDYYAQLQLGSYERERFETTKSTLVAGAEVARREGFRLAVFFIPIKFRVYGDLCRYPPNSPCQAWKPWDLARAFVEFCDSAGLECVDLTGPMRRAAATGQVLYAPEDSHWSREGHEFVARQVAETWERLERGASP